jgi:hypothetical protein
MNRWMICLMTILSFPLLALGQSGADTRTFDLTPTPPTVPALKYMLLFDPVDRLDGNAALQYDAAMQLLFDKEEKEISDADELLTDQPEKRSEFSSAAAPLDAPNLVSLLELGGRCQYCDWQPPMRELGINTLLPHLNQTREMANYLTVRAVYFARNGNVSEALRLTKLEVELGSKIGQEQVLVSGLVGIGIVANAGVALHEVMIQPDCPNLYWALASLPRPMISLRNCLSGERIWIYGTFHELRADRIDDLSADGWHSVFKRMVDYSKQPGMAASSMAWANDQTVADEVKRNLPEAAAAYAQAHNISADQAEQLDPFKLVAWYWFEQCQDLQDDNFKLSSLPYPQAAAKWQQFADRYKQMVLDQPANPFLNIIPALAKAARTFVRSDRMLAALTDVEAIRSYAAANNGNLPDSLSSITDTPALDNPMTGKPFNYQVKGDTATLSDPQPSQFPLSYTVRIRQ